MSERPPKQSMGTNPAQVRSTSIAPVPRRRRLARFGPIWTLSLGDLPGLGVSPASRSSTLGNRAKTVPFWQAFWPGFSALPARTPDLSPGMAHDRKRPGRAENRTALLVARARPTPSLSAEPGRRSARSRATPVRPAQAARSPETKSATLRSRSLAWPWSEIAARCSTSAALLLSLATDATSPMIWETSVLPAAAC